MSEAAEATRHALYEQAVAIVRESDKVTAPFLQRRLQIGFNLASYFIEKMEASGVVGPADAKGKREVLPEKTSPESHATEAAPPLPDDRTVPLNLLDEGGDDNVRTSATKAEIESLMASIIHHGLLQPLVVAPLGERFKVGAGNRRLKAFKLAHKQGLIPKDHPIPVRFAALADLHEVSLTENVMRVALHPVDEFEAFRQRLDEGVTVAAIADRFGLKEKAVRQRLALGGLAPEVRKAWRDGKIGQEQAEDFTICDDHEVQREALKVGLASKYGWPEYETSRILRAGRDNASTGDFAFVGRDAYVAAGGALREDLFGDVVLIENPDILRRLLDEKIAAVKRELVEIQGWAFAFHQGEVENSYRWATLPLERWMTDEERASTAGKSPTSPTVWSIRTNVAKRAAELPEARAESGVFFSINGRGEISLDPLRVRPPDAEQIDDGEDDDRLDDTDRHPEREDGSDAADVPAAAPAVEEVEHGLSKALVEDLSEQLSNAIADCLVRDPDLALRAAVAALTTSGWGSPLKLSRQGSPIRKIHADITFTERFRALRPLTRDALLTELALAMGPAIDIRSSQEQMDTKLVGGRDALIAEIQPDEFRAAVARAFTPSEFFDRASAKVAKTAVEESRGHSVGGKKDEVAGVATTVARETGWLPGPLRTVHYRAPAPAARQTTEA